MIDQISQFLANGQNRRRALNAALDEGLHKYLEPTGIPARLDAIGEARQ